MGSVVEVGGAFLRNLTGATSPSRFGVPQPLKSPTYMDVYSFEREFHFDEWRGWLGTHWMTSVYASLVYVALIFGGRRWMKGREAFDLRRPLFVWNVFLATFSVFGFFRVVPEILHLLSFPGGFHTSVCFRDGHNMATVFWGFWCTLSKMVELGDTAFIVLRKQPLIFLHWYHHITVMLYTWFTYEEYDPSLKLFMCMNFFVHGIMYSYYGLKSLGAKIPRSFAMVITSLQISQMILGVWINVHSLIVKVGGGECGRQYRDISLALAMYFSYFVLFANFFRNVYLKRKEAEEKRKAK